MDSQRGDLFYLLFFPESMGLVSHLFYPSAIVLNGHRVRPPLLSLVGESPNLYMSAMTGRGIGRVGFAPYWHMNPPLSDMLFYAQNPSEHLPLTYFANEAAALDKTMNLGDETISCWRISRGYETPPPDFLRLECRTSRNDFLAGFAGPHEDANIFYAVLESATESK